MNSPSRRRNRAQRELVIFRIGGPHLEEHIMLSSKLKLGLALSAMTLALAGCGSERGTDTAVGAGAGAIGGAILTGGSPIGTVGGAAVGGLVGNQVGKDAR
jgi:osmotically inducible lipoprotein OsmB